MRNLVIAVLAYIAFTMYYEIPPWNGLTLGHFILAFLMIGCVGVVSHYWNSDKTSHTCMHCGGSGNVNVPGVGNIRCQTCDGSGSVSEAPFLHSVVILLFLIGGVAMVTGMMRKSLNGENTPDAETLAELPGGKPTGGDPSTKSGAAKSRETTTRKTKTRNSKSAAVERRNPGQLPIKQPLPASAFPTERSTWRGTVAQPGTGKTTPVVVSVTLKGSRLAGTMQYTALADARVQLTGTIDDEKIRLRAVKRLSGSRKILVPCEYTGTFSGDRISGNWQGTANGTLIGAGFELVRIGQ